MSKTVTGKLVFKCQRCGEEVEKEIAYVSEDIEKGISMIVQGALPQINMLNYHHCEADKRIGILELVGANYEHITQKRLDKLRDEYKKAMMRVQAEQPKIVTPSHDIEV